VVVGLFAAAAPLPETLRSAAGCVAAPSATVDAIRKHPADYYVNVHTGDFPDGAIRGQLHRGAAKPHASGKLDARLRGFNEVPTLGDPDGLGQARVRLHGTEVCFAIRWQEIASPTLAHIHSGAAGVPGPVVVNFLHDLAGPLPDTINAVDGCVHDVDAQLVRAIREHPSNYYVNVHNADFPAGAIRGQLH
jgi:hypothetical protein